MRSITVALIALAIAFHAGQASAVESGEIAEPVKQPYSWLQIPMLFVVPRPLETCDEASRRVIERIRQVLNEEGVIGLGSPINFPDSSCRES